MLCCCYKLKKQLVPWNSIEKLKKKHIKEKIKETIDKFYITRSDVENLYKIKHEYLEKNPDKYINQYIWINIFTC